MDNAAIAKDIAIRVDASEAIGCGHIMRSIALGQMLQDRGKNIHFVCISYDEKFLQAIKDENFYLHLIEENQTWDARCDVRKLLGIVESLDVQWVIVDGYKFDAEYQNVIKESGYKLMCIDDNALFDQVADVVLNQNIHAKRSMYKAGGDNQYYLGPGHALLRREFLNAEKRFHRKIARNVTNILVTLGGADQDNVTLKVLKALAALDLKGLTIKVIVGPLNTHKKEIEEFCRNSKNKLEIHSNVNKDMPEYMLWADLAVTAGGSMVWEYALFATPLIVLIVAQNQEALVNRLDEMDSICSAGWHHQASEESLKERIRKLCQDAGERMRLSSSIGGVMSPRKITEVVERLAGV